jgi:ABC-type Zn uptake system ZnuABC Zn-binding protein ZnuA
MIGMLVMVMVAALCGCNTTSTICEFDKDGKLIKKTETNESALNAVVRSASGKSLIIYEGGWMFFLEVSPGTSENPTPHFTAKGGNQNSVYASILPDQERIPSGMAEIIRAAKSGDISVGPKGISSNNNEQK